MKSLKAIWETRLDRPARRQHTSTAVEPETDASRTPTHYMNLMLPLSLNDEAEDALSRVRDQRAAVQFYSNLEENYEGLLIGALMNVGADRETAHAVVKAWLIQNF